MNFDKYETTVKCPKRPKKPQLTLFYLKEGGISAPEIEKRVMAKYDEDLKKYNETYAEYQKDLARVNEMFKMDALTETGLIDHPNSDQIYEVAERAGRVHREIFLWLQNLSFLSDTPRSKES